MMDYYLFNQCLIPNAQEIDFVINKFAVELFALDAIQRINSVFRVENKQ